MKKDKYLRARGGNAKMINVSCMKCECLLFVYQKDGPGWLKRCYLNRIIFPEKYGKIQEEVKDIKEMKNLVCDCGEIIGSPMVHKDNRLAFHLIRGKFKRTINKKKDFQ
jgi:hypothetical protein